MGKAIVFIILLTWMIFWNILVGLILLCGILIVCALCRLIFSRRQYIQKYINPAELRKGDLILIGSNCIWDSWYIKLSNILTNGIDSKYWTHVALYCGDGELVEALPEGIRLYKFKDYLDANALVLVLRHKYVQYNETLEKVVQFGLDVEKEDYSYGWVGILFYVLASFIPVSCNFIFRNTLIDQWCNLDYAYFCSELISDAYKEGGYTITPYDSWRIKPSDLLYNPFFQEVECTPPEVDKKNNAPATSGE